MPSPALILRSLFTEPIFFFLSVIAYLSPAPIPPWLSGFLLNVLGIDILQSHNYLPHHSAPFEGYYTRISTDSDATILIIFSTVRDAKPENKPNLLHFSYLPKERKGRGNEDDAIVINVFPGSIVYDGQAASVDSSLLEITATTSRADRGEPLGRYIVTPKEDGSEYLSYKLLLPEDNGEKSSTSPGGARTRSWISVSIDLGKREPWDGEVGGRHNTPASGPEGPVSALIHLLPLHWFVWSVGSPANVTIKRVIRPDGVKPTEVTMQPLRDDLIWAGKGRAHAEKNWGWSFPKGWVW